MVGVGEQSLSAELLHGFGQDRLDGCLGAHGGEGGGLNLSVRGGDDTGASAELSAVGFYTFSAGGGGVRQAAGDGEAKVLGGERVI